MADNSTYVKSFKAKGHIKEVNLIVGKKTIKLNFPRFAPISINDPIFIEKIDGSKIHTLDVENNTKIIIKPEYSYEDFIYLGKNKFKYDIHEIINSEDLKNWELLEQFHYRTHSNLVSDKEDDEKQISSTGRNCVLINLP